MTFRGRRGVIAELTASEGVKRLELPSTTANTLAKVK
jgi:hypothetical protein